LTPAKIIVERLLPLFFRCVEDIPELCEQCSEIATILSRFKDKHIERERLKCSSVLGKQAE